MTDNRRTEMRRGDLKPDLVYTAYDADTSTDLTTVVSWRLIGVSGGTTVFNDTTPVVNTPDADEKWRVTLTHLWQPAETATVRPLKVQAEATWPGGKPQTFPSVTVDIRPDLG